MILNDAQIEAQMQEVINDKWPPAQREKALRMGGTLLTSLNAFFADMAKVKAQKIADRDFAQALHDYSQAKYQLPNEPELVSLMDEKGNVTEVPNPKIAELQAVITGVSADVIAAYEESLL